MSHILVIDDEDLIRDAVRQSLEHHGHTVTTAENGRKGLALYDPATIDLVLTDLIMPEKEGLETIMELRAKYPRVKIVAMSGGGRNSPRDYLLMARQLGATGVLAKPFSIEALIQVVDEALGQKPA